MAALIGGLGEREAASQGSEGRNPIIIRDGRRASKGVLAPTASLLTASQPVPICLARWVRECLGAWVRLARSSAELRTIGAGGAAHPELIWSIFERTRLERHATRSEKCVPCEPPTSQGRHLYSSPSWLYMISGLSMMGFSASMGDLRLFYPAGGHHDTGWHLCPGPHDSSWPSVC